MRVVKERPAGDACLWRHCAVLSLLVWPLAARPAEKIEPIDTDFLEYLAELEGAEEDWTLFEMAEPRPQPAKTEPQKAKPKPEATESDSTDRSKTP